MTFSYRKRVFWLFNFCKQFLFLFFFFLNSFGFFI